ncbi:MAG: radical SAM protein [Nanoarchaeota archaeon]
MKIALLSTSTFPADQGLRTISSYLKSKEHQVQLIFLPLPEDYSIKYPVDVLNQVESKISDCKLIGINAYASTNDRAKQLISLGKKLNIPVVWGGPHPTFFPEDCFKYCDIIAVGEAEDAFVDLANSLERNQDISKIPNLWVRTNKTETKNHVRPPIHDLDMLPHQDFDIDSQLILENSKLIHFEERHIGGMLFFQTERGCPQACSYCTNNILREIYKGKSDLLRTHSVDYVIEEFVDLKNRFPSISVIDIRDETFLIRPIEWLREFSEKYKEKVGLRMKCLTEPASISNEVISSEKLSLLVDAGLSDIIVGIQSGSDQLNFKLYNRFISAAQVIKSAIAVNKFKDKLTVMYDIIACNPYETREDVLATINLIRQLPKPFYLSVNNLIFFEGTPLYRKAIQDGFIKDGKDTASDLNYWDRWKHIKLKKKNMYLSLVLNLMRGPCTDMRYGLIPASVLNRLIKDSSVTFNEKHLTPTYAAGTVVQSMDFFRENLAKPIFRRMPLSFRSWYDKVRYQA